MNSLFNPLIPRVTSIQFPLTISPLNLTQCGHENKENYQQLKKLLIVTQTLKQALIICKTCKIDHLVSESGHK